MKCPYCGQEMQSGNYRTNRDGTIIWFPKDVKYKGLFFNNAKVEAQGGIVLGDTSDTELSQKVGYACKNCRILVTKF